MAHAIGKALVTGGAGFIGSHIAQVLVQRGCEVTILDNLTSGHLDNLDAVMDAITFIEGDIRDETILARVTKGCDVVFHQAAVVSVTQTVQQPVVSATINDLGTLKVLDAARLNKVRRFVLASSSAVYGDDPQLPKIESMRPNPMSPYAAHKLTNESYANIFYRLYGMETVCLRYFNVYGPRQDPSSPYSGVISIFMTRASNDTQPIIYGDGHQTRDFIYVQDVVRANLLAAECQEAKGQVFNVGSGVSVDINTLWKKISQLAHCGVTPRYENARPGDIIHSLAGIQKARQSLGFEPSVSLDDGLAQTISWYEEVE